PDLAVRLAVLARLKLAYWCSGMQKFADVGMSPSLASEGRNPAIVQNPSDHPLAETACRQPENLAHDFRSFLVQPDRFSGLAFEPCWHQGGDCDPGLAVMLLGTPSRTYALTEFLAVFFSRPRFEDVQQRRRDVVQRPDNPVRLCDVNFDASLEYPLE